VRALAKDLLAGTQQESLWATQSDRVVLMPGPDGGTKIYLRLQQVPHIETLRLTWKEQNLDPSRVRLHKNIVVTRFQESVRKLSKDPFLVTYVPDSEHSADLATMNIVDGSVEVDGQPVENLLQ